MKMIASVEPAFELFLGRRRGLVVLSAVRIGYGVTTVLMLLVNLPIRKRLWGDEAAYDWSTFVTSSAQAGQFSLYGLSSSAIWADILYFGTMIAAGLFALGWHTRVITVVFFITLWSLHVRNPLVTNGGDNIMRIVLLYMIFAQTNRYWSLDALRFRHRTRSPWRERVSPYVTAAHNTALIASVLQVVVLYFSSGLYKVQGRMWQDGTAVYYVMRTADYNTWPELSRLIYQWPVVVVVATYATIVVQLLLPVSLLHPGLKKFVLPAALGMHAAIGLFMGLPYFSLFMIVTDLLFLTDDDLRGLAARSRRSLARLRSRTTDLATPLPVTAPPMNAAIGKNQ